MRLRPPPHRPGERRREAAQSSPSAGAARFRWPALPRPTDRRSAHTRGKNPPCRTACPTTATPRRSCGFDPLPPAPRDAHDGTAERSAGGRPASRTTAAHWHATGDSRNRSTRTSSGNCNGGTPISSAITPNQTKRDQVVQHMVAVVRPERHLPLRVVQRVQRPPPAELVRQPVPDSNRRNPG